MHENVRKGDLLAFSHEKREKNVGRNLPHHEKRHRISRRTLFDEKIARFVGRDEEAEVLTSTNEKIPKP